MRKINDKWKRILSVLLVCAMLLQLYQMPGVYAASVPDSENAPETVADTEEMTEAYEETDTAYFEEDLQNTQTEFYEEEQEDVQEAEDVSVQAASDSSDMQITTDKTLTLTKDETVSGITIAKDATLIIDTDGYSLTVTGDISGDGAIVLKGKNIKVQNIALKSITLDNAEVDAAVDASETDANPTMDNQITAKESFIVKDSTISNAAFVGYDETVTGSRTLEFQGNNSLKNISLVGSKENGEANVAIEGYSTITLVSNTNFCCDYTLTYQYGNETLEPETDWPVTYRVKYTGSINSTNAALIGWHNAGDGETAGTYQAASEITLPSYAVKGYSSTGWKVNDDTEVKTVLSGKLSGNLTLTAEMQAASVTVSMDLGYTPDDTTNDDYSSIEKITTQAANWEQNITLGTPKRFGYQFAGWKVAADSDENQSETIYRENYQVKVEDAQVSSDGNYLIQLQAQWTAKSFPFRFFITGTDETLPQVIDGENTYASPAEYAEAHSNIGWNSQSKQLEFPEIQYGESLADYIKRIRLENLPILKDNRTGAVRKDFTGWDTPGGQVVNSEMTYTVGSLLDNRTVGTTLEKYEEDISSTPVFLTSTWGTAEYTFSVENADGWEIVIDDEVQTLAGGQLSKKVAAGTEITFRCSSQNPVNFSLWRFSVGFMPTETAYTSGSKYITYTAPMPYQDVTASYYKSGQKIYIDLSESGITFEENVTLPSGRTADGFWYQEKMMAETYTASDKTEMTVNAMTPAFQAEDSDTEHAGKYFYIWNFKDTFCVTSCGKETQKQLTLVNAMTVAMKACKLSPTNDYKTDAVGRKLKGILLEGREASGLQMDLANLDLRQYGNIILDVGKHPLYTTQIEVEGDNAAGVIVQSLYDASTAYIGTLNVKGTTGKTTDKLTISGTLLNQHLNFESLTLLEDKNVESDYLLYCSATNEGIGNIAFSGCDIEAKNKRIYTYRGVLNFKRNDNQEDSSMNIGGVRTYGASNIYANSYIRCFGDWLAAYNTLNLYGNSNVVIDGNLLTTYSHWTAGARIDTTGYLIVKGNRAELENFTMLQGTLIANAAVLGRSCNIAGGTLIANQLMNSPAKYPSVNANGEYKYGDKGSCVELKDNDDNYPFVTYAQDNAKEGQFVFGENSKIYLLGYYKTSGSLVYDTSVNAIGTGNPVAEVIRKVISEDGNLNASFDISDEELQDMVKNSSNTQNECVMFGSSTFNTAARMRSVLISGAEIYAAGNLTFFNDTEITSGSVYCNGRLSGKRDLTISGTAKVEASEVGNNYNLTTEDGSGITRWQKTTISGGTITTDQLGASSAPYVPDSTITPQSTLVISGKPVIQARTTEKMIEYATDVYINYLADKETFEIPTGLPVSVRYKGSDYQNLTMEQAVTLSNPTLIGGTGTANWVLDSLSGENVDTINNDAAFSFNDKKIADKSAYKERDHICFYAVKGTYDLSVAEGADKISKIQIGDSAYTNFESVISTNREAEVTVTLNDTSMAGKSVIWYQDAAKKFYNVNPTETTKNGQTTLTFTMPAASVQIYVTDEMKLYLNRYEISLTSDGFRTQYDAETEGETVSSFKYAGNLVITQDNITGTAFVKKKQDSDRSVGVTGILESQSEADGTQLTGATENRLHIESVNANRSVTLNKVIMDGGQDVDKIIIDENCGNVELQIDGAVRLLSVYLQTGSNLIFKGKNQKTAGESGQDILHFDSGSASTANITGFINNGKEGKTGSVTFDHLNILRSNEYYAASGSTRRCLVYSPSPAASAVAAFKDCNMEATVESSMTLVSNYPEVVIENSNFDIETTNGWNSVLLNSCSKVTITGGSFSYTCGCAYNSFPLYYGAEDFCIDGAKVSLSNVYSDEKATYYMIQPDNMLPDNFTVKNAGELNVDHRIKLKKLTLSSDGDAVPTVNVGKGENETYDGSLLCKDITVEKGKIHTGRLLISGYYNAPVSDQDYESKTQIISQMQAKNNMVQNGTLTLKDGTIEASEEIGGALGGTITVEGGQITSSAIGSCDKVYGYGKSLPTKVEDEWIYSISRIPDALTLNLQGGTINVPSGGYLGGMNAFVNIEGGDIQLQGNSVLGMTEAQKKQLSDYYSSRGDDIAAHTATNCLVTISSGSIEQENSGTVSGSIQAPYGSVTISGADTKIKVSNIQSEYGSIRITQAQGSYDNPYKGDESSNYKSNTVGIYVTDTLSAQTVDISDGAQVYAENAYAEVVNENGTYNGMLSVKKAGLYAGAYGEKGISREDNEKQYNDKAGDSERTVFGTRMVSVTYVLNPQNILSEEDAATVTNDNSENYTVGTGSVELVDAACQGYDFLGWYDNAECSGVKVTQLNTSIANDLTLYAKWEKIQVKFRVMMDDKSPSYAKEEFENNNNWVEASDSNAYLSNKEVTLPYGSLILTSDGVNLLDYNTNTLGITELEYAEDVIGFAGTALTASSTVTKALAEYYKEQAAKADANEDYAILLHVKNVQKRVATITFSVNKKDGKPSDAALKGSSGTVAAITASVGVDKAIGTINSFADDSVTEGNSKGLIQPTATGYTFVGWNTNADATKDTTKGWVDSTIVFKENTTVYAIWQANTYLVEFNAGDGSWVTTDSTEPDVEANEVKILNYYWVYDTPVTSGNSFWLKDEQSGQAMQELPYAWREGYTFEHDAGWTYSYTENGENKTGVVTSTEELSQLAVQALDVKKGNPDGKPTEVALKLNARYSPVKVKYNLNGGTWKVDNASDEVTPDYGAALAGYVKADNTLNSAEGSSIDKIGTVTGANNAVYYVASTTAASYKSDNKFDASDYRNTLSKKGYTFYGWYTSQSDANKVVNATTSSDTAVTSVGTTPRFKDVELYAAWKANSYTLNLQPSDSNKSYEYTSFSTNEVAGGINVTVGKAIEDSASKWPSRTGDGAWYAYNKSISSPIENQKRYFLGATFAALDPGTTDNADSNNPGYQVYQTYQKEVLALQDDGMIYQTGDGSATGSIFTLPEDEDYQAAASSANISIPDYPNGSEVTMYAVYRAMSLVFVERYIDPDGVLQEHILHTAPYDEYDKYPTKYENSDITKLGYRLLGWYVNNTTATGTKYPDNKEDYQKQLATFKEEAKQNKTYDIMVYTVYTSQLTTKISLDAKQDPTEDSFTTYSYTLPASMQEGIFSMKLIQTDSTNPLKFVSVSEMGTHQYDQTWKDVNGMEHSSDDTVAVQVTVSASPQTVTGEKTVVMDLSEVSSEGTLNFNGINAAAGSQITLTLYHSKVMTADKTWQFNLEAHFEKNENGSNILENQKMTNEVSVHLKPSQYIVHYTVTLPEELQNLTLNNWGGFLKDDMATNNTNALAKTVKTDYGSELLQIPKLEGYAIVDDGWKEASGTDAYTKLTVPVTAENNGEVSLSSSYEEKMYPLSVSVDVLTHWDISYTDGLNSTTKQLSSTDANGNDVSADLKYHSTVTFKPKDSLNPDPAEFVTLSIQQSSESSEDEVAAAEAVLTRLNEYGKENSDDGSYTFTMPALEVEASYAAVESLYLDDGTISITENGYTQTKTSSIVEKTWRGDYVILQNQKNNAETATDNTLKISGDVSGRTITLGNLNISSDNSIALETADSSGNTKASLTLQYDNNVSTLSVKNILVPAGAELNLKGASSDAADPSKYGTINATPVKMNAAIGGNESQKASGTITLDKLNLSLTMEPGSMASGVGGAERFSNGNSDDSLNGGITLTNCQLTVSEGSSTAVYQGAWIGGSGVKNIHVSNTSIQRATYLHMAGPVITEAKNVEITNSTIGAENQAVNNPVYASESLTLNHSKVYITLQDDISDKSVSSLIGTSEDGKCIIQDSIVKAEKSGGKVGTASLYTGQMVIQDAASDVTLEGTQLLEVSNGDMSINGNVYTQAGEEKTSDSSRRNYLLLAEKDVQSGAEDTSNVLGASSLTIASMTDTGDVEVRQPKNVKNIAVDLKDLVVQASTKLVLGGNLTVSGTASIGPADASNVKLTVQNAGTGTYELKFTGNTTVFDTNIVNGTNNANSTNNADSSDIANSYEQTGGKLTTESDFGSGALNVLLTNVTAKVTNLYAKDLKVTGGSVTASGSTDSSNQGTVSSEVGSKPADSAAATKVVFSETTIKAETIGALGTYDQTFTLVTSESSALTGTLVQDCYYIKYDTSGKNFDTRSLKHVLRSSTVMDGSDSESATATTIYRPMEGLLNGPADASDFTCWYINVKAVATSADGGSESAASTESTVRKAILADSESVPAGLSGKTTLNGDTIDQVIDSDVTENSDGTKTLTVHAWIKSTVTLAIQQGRLFQKLLGERTTVSVPSNSAWTAQFISTGTSISGRDYEVDFASALPAGTNLTLTVPGDTDHTGEYYYYTVSDGSSKSVKFSEFTVMGGTDKFQTKTYADDSIPEDETFLLAADFANTEANAVSNTVTFKLLTSSDSFVTFEDTLSYTLTQTKAGEVKVDADSKKVTVTMPENDARLIDTNNKVFLKAVLKNQDSQEKIPYNVSADWNGKTGTWISRDMVIFEVSDDSLSGSYSFSGLKNGNYNITWGLVYGTDAKDNIAGNRISEEVIADYTESHTEPSLSVTSDAKSHVISAGTETSVTFTYTTATNAEVQSVDVTVEKQTSLGAFTAVQPEGAVTVKENGSNSKTVTFTAQAETGTYRVVFSIDKNSSEDNVYETFIVE